MKLCKELGLNPDTYSVSIPLGSTINMAGATVTINTLTLAAVNTLGIQVDFGTAWFLSVVSSCFSRWGFWSSRWLPPLDSCRLQPLWYRQ